MTEEQKIYLDFENARQTAGRLEEMAISLNAVSAGPLGDSLAMVSKSWEGKNCSCFVEKGNVLFDDLQSAAEVLVQTAAGLRTAAENMLRAELAALECCRR